MEPSTPIAKKREKKISTEGRLTPSEVVRNELIPPNTRELTRDAPHVVEVRVVELGDGPEPSQQRLP